MSYANSNNSISSFLANMSSISNSYFITLAQISSNILNKSGENRHLCFPSDLRKKIVQSYTTKYNVSYKVFCTCLLPVEEVPSHLIFLTFIIINVCWICQMFFSLSTNMITWLFFFSLLIQQIILTNLSNIEPVLC